MGGNGRVVKAIRTQDDSSLRHSVQKGTALCIPLAQRNSGKSIFSYHEKIMFCSVAPFRRNRRKCVMHFRLYVTGKHRPLPQGAFREESFRDLGL